MPRAEDQEEFLAPTRASRAFHRPWGPPPLTAPGIQDYLRRDERDGFEALLACERASGRIAEAFERWALSREDWRPR